MGELVKVAVDGAVAQVTITREKALNALNNDVLGELIEAVTQLDGTAEVRAVILTGAGDKAFVAGADIAQMVEMPAEDAERFSTRAGALGRAIERSRLVWIAAVNGFALGGGCELAMICDFIYASDKARFGQPEVKLGVIPGFGGTQRLTRRVGVGKAKELCVTGDMIDAAEALRIGLCDKVVPHAELLDTARAAAERISKNGPQAVAETKRVILQGQSLPLDEALALETRVFAGLFETSDQREGMAAFLAKRPATSEASDVDFRLSEEQELLQRTARDFAQKEVLPKAAAIDREHRHPDELVARMAELGLLGIAVPDQYGGSGMDNLSYALAMEEVSRACASTGVIMSVNNSLVCDPLLRFGTEEHKKKWLAPLAAGKKLGCFALSEPEAGSDAAAQRTTAIPNKDGNWVLQGTKNWITNGPVADVCVLFAMNDRDQGHRGITCFIVPMDTKGVRTGPPDDKLGIRGSKSCQIFLDDAVIGADQVLGEVGGGFKVAMSTLDGGRIGIAAQAVGIARAAFEDALEYAQNRKTFGKPISGHQAIQFKLADMATEIDAARLLIWRAAELKDRGQPYGKAAAMAKLYASDVANRAAREAIQIFGGNGYVTEFPVERHFRDAKITEIYEGTSEIQRLVIANHLLKGN